MRHASAPVAQPRLMIVDDDPGTIRMLIEILKDFGRIEFATSGTEAIGMARSICPDVVILDIEMPGMDGFEVCQRFKGDTALAEVPIMFLTVRDDVDSEVRAIEMGGRDFITKPFNPVVVRARIANCLALKRRTDQLNLLTMVDGLTEVANRRAFDAALEQEWSRSCRTRTPLSLLMIDVDHFKEFNDAYGHPAGDDCLRTIAAAVAAVGKRPGDLAARYGGEEFALLLPACERDQAILLADSVRKAVSDMAIPHAGSGGLRVKISVGVASLSPVGETVEAHPDGTGHHGIREPTSTDLVKAADDALYQAKKAGRNTVRSNAVMLRSDASE